MTTIIVTVRRVEDVQEVMDSLAHLGEIEPYSALKRAFMLHTEEDEAEIMWTLSANPKVSGAMNGDDPVEPAAYEPEWLYEGRVFTDKAGALRLKANQDPDTGHFNPWWQQPGFFQWRKDSDRLGQDAIIAVVDSGIRYGHPEFQADPSRITRIYNYNTVSEAGNHGTAVASVAAGDINGIAPLAELWDSRVFPPTGSTSTAAIVAGLNAVLSYATTPGNNPSNKKVIVNMSFSSAGANLSNPYGTIVADLQDAGLIPIAAAGNNGQNLDGSWNEWPAEVTDYAVGAIHYDGREATFTNKGRRVVFYGFGHQVPAAGYPGAYGTDPINGTSFAAPYVCGCLATWVGGRFTPVDSETVRILMNDYLAFCQEGIYGRSVRNTITGAVIPGKVIGRASYFPIEPGKVIVPNKAIIASFGTAEIGVLAWKSRVQAIMGGVPMGVGAPNKAVVAILEGPFFANADEGPWIDPAYVPTGWDIENDRIRNLTGGAGLGKFVVANHVMDLKEYWEVEIKSAATDISVGITVQSHRPDYDNTTTAFGADGFEWFADGSLDIDGVAQTATTTFAQGDRLMLAFDADTGEFWIGKNGTWTDDPDVDPATGTVATPGNFYAAVGLGAANGSVQFYAHNRFYLYTKPTDFTDFITGAETQWVMDVALNPGGYVISEGDTRITNVSGGSNYLAWIPSVQRIPASYVGKVYWEMEGIAGAADYNGYHALSTVAAIAAGTSGTNPIENGSTGRRGIGALWASTTGAPSQVVTGLLTYGVGDRLMMCFNPSTGELWTGVNGVWDDDPDTQAATHVVYTAGQTEWAVTLHARVTNDSVKLHSLSTSLTYPLPSGAIALGQL